MKKPRFAVFLFTATLLAAALPLNSAHAEGGLFDNPKNSLPGAVEANDPPRVKYFLGRGENPDGKNNNGVPALVLAAMGGNPLIVKMLLDAHARGNLADENRNTALHWAAKRGDADVLLLLLDAKVPTDMQNREGATPLMLAAGAGHTGTIRLLLQSHADGRVMDYSGHDALDWAEDNRRNAAAKLLREAGITH